MCETYAPALRLLAADAPQAIPEGTTPSNDHDHAPAFASLGIPAFACTPDLFPELMAAAILRTDLGAWAARNEAAS